MEGYTKKHKLIKDTRRRKTEKRDRKVLEEAHKEAKKKAWDQQLQDYHDRFDQQRNTGRYVYIPYPQQRELNPEEREKLWRDTRSGKFIPAEDWGDSAVYRFCKEMLEAPLLETKIWTYLSLTTFVSSGGLTLIESRHLLEEFEAHNSPSPISDRSLLTIFKQTFHERVPTLSKKQTKQLGCIPDVRMFVLILLQYFVAVWKTASVHISSEFGPFLHDIVDGNYDGTSYDEEQTECDPPKEDPEERLLLRRTSLELLILIMFFDHLGWAEGKEVSENRLYEGISEILKKYLCPVRDSENATSLAITATSMFGLVITLLPPRWVHNIYSDWFPTFLELLDDRDLYLRVAAGENIALMLEMNESAENKIEWDQRDIYHLASKTSSLMTGHDSRYTKKERRLQQTCFQALWDELLESDQCAAAISKNTEFDGFIRGLGDEEEEDERNTFTHYRLLLIPEIRIDTRQSHLVFKSDEYEMDINPNPAAPERHVRQSLVYANVCGWKHCKQLRCLNHLLGEHLPQLAISEILFPLVKEIVEMSEVEITAYPPVKPGQKVGRRAMIAAGKTPHRNNVNKGDKTPWMAITPVDGRLRRTKPMPLKPRSTRYNYYSYSSGHAAPSTQPLDIQPNNNRSDRAPYSVTPLSSKVNLF